MKLHTFLGAIREESSSVQGKFVGARFTRESEKKLMDWMRENHLRKKEPRARLHVTVIGDPQKDFDWNPATFEPPLEVDPRSYRLERFKDGEVLVLRFTVPELEKRHREGCEKHGITWKHPTYDPHVTLSFDPKGLNDDRRLLTPTFPLYIQGEYVQPWEYNPQNEATERRRKKR